MHANNRYGFVVKMNTTNKVTMINTFPLFLSAKMTEAALHRFDCPVKHCLIQPRIRWPFGPTTHESYFMLNIQSNTMQRENKQPWGTELKLEKRSSEMVNERLYYMLVGWFVRFFFVFFSFGWGSFHHKHTQFKLNYVRIAKPKQW